MTRITTPTHAIVVTLYASQVILGIEYLIGLAKAQTMEILVGLPVTNVWALIMFLSALTGLAAVFSINQRPLRALGAEMWAAIILGIVSLLYEVTIVIGNGITSVLTTQTYALAVGVGCIARAIQIHRERARAQQEVTDTRER